MIIYIRYLLPLSFRAESHNNVYAFDLQLFDEVDMEQSKWNTKGRNIILNIGKKNTEAEHWPRLTKDKIKNSHIQIDWSKWVDEDEEDEQKPMGEEWDQNNMNNFDMGGGYGGGDSDDEEEEEEEHDHAGHGGPGHVHGEGCSHGHGDHAHGDDEQKKKSAGADLGDLDADVEDVNQQPPQ